MWDKSMKLMKTNYRIKIIDTIIQNIMLHTHFCNSHTKQINYKRKRYGPN